MFYRLLSTPDPAYQKFFNDDEYADFFKKLKEEYFSLDYFDSIYSHTKCPELMPGYFGSSASIYKRWKALPDDKRCSLDDLADMTADLFMHGLNYNKNER